MDNDPEFIAKTVNVVNRQVCLDLEDGSTFSFPCAFFHRLASASNRDLEQVRLRVGGRALRWDSLDEDIWIADAVMRRYPNRHPG